MPYGEKETLDESRKAHGHSGGRRAFQTSHQSALTKGAKAPNLSVKIKFKRSVVNGKIVKNRKAADGVRSFAGRVAYYRNHKAGGLMPSGGRRLNAGRKKNEVERKNITFASLMKNGSGSYAWPEAPGRWRSL